MSTIANCVPQLVNGERMKQAEFHRRYEACDEDEKWELVGGIVYLTTGKPGPLRLGHSSCCGKIGLVLELYEFSTPGTQTLHNATTILDDDSEPQPDLGLRILPEYGGQSRTTADDYFEGAPELLVEIAITSAFKIVTYSCWQHTGRMDVQSNSLHAEEDGATSA